MSDKQSWMSDEEWTEEDEAEMEAEENRRDDKIYQEMIDTQFFIDRQGKKHVWKWGLEAAKDWVSLHAGLANKLFPEIKDPTTYVYNIGWIIWGSECYGYKCKKKPTQAQKIGRAHV